MQAVRFVKVGDVQLQEVSRPTVSPGQVLLRVLAAGVCQTDTHIRRSTEQMIPDGITLGHEIAGEIVEMAEGVEGLRVGQRVVVHPVWSCGVCALCVAGMENACRNTGDRLHPAATPGISVDGGMAEYVAVQASAVIPADGLDPAFAAVLTDAGLVPFHSITATRHLLRPGSTAIVVGVGGLGQFAVQILRAVTGARIVALDVRDAALEAVAGHVDHAFRSDDPDVERKVLDAIGKYGADVVLDFVGSSATLAMDGRLVAPYGAIRVPGLSDGRFEFETSQLSTSLPWGASVTRPYSGTHQDLFDLVALARTGRLSVDLKRYDFADAVQAMDDLDSGAIVGRAVLLL